MNITQVNGPSSLDQIYAAQAAGASAAQPTSSATATSDQVSLSGPAQLLSSLQSLKQSDPVALKQKLSDIADQLHTQAQSVGGAKGAQLDKIASQFQDAAQTGDLSKLQSPTQSGMAHGHHGGHKHHGGGSSQSLASMFDPTGAQSTDPLTALTSLDPATSSAFTKASQ